MRQRVITMLDFPRRVVRAEMDLVECPHGGEFDSDDNQCQECADGPECQWLYATDAVAALGSRTLNQLSEALEFAIISVAANAIRQGHDPQQCRCPMCDWLTQAEALKGELI
ncbi:MAG: hypothetical protein ACC641_05120 [Acidiferrobacterales bacterium]